MKSFPDSWVLNFASKHETQINLPNVILMLAHRLRRWANIKTTLVERLLFDGMNQHMVLVLHISFCIFPDYKKLIVYNRQAIVGPMTYSSLSVCMSVCLLSAFPCEINMFLVDINLPDQFENDTDLSASAPCLSVCLSAFLSAVRFLFWD